MTATRRAASAVLIALMVASFAASCSEKTQESAKETTGALQEDAEKNARAAGTQLEEKSGEAQARAAAEDLRVRIKANETAKATGLRSIAAINQSVADVAGDPQVIGATDADGDGFDDDGKVQINASGASACLTLPQTGDNTTVQGGAC